MSKPFYVPLPNRGLIHVEGEDRVEFLQGLISHNVEKLETSHILYGCLLTPQGKFLHDFFLHQGDEFILIDCEGGARAEDLYNRLNKYRLRSKVKLSVEPYQPVYALFNSEEGLPDPRHFKMGNRTFEKPLELDAEPFEEWDMQRIILGVPDGSRDMEVERSTLLECNIDKFNGLDFDKGCYMGQELTARMHHRNLGKKHLRSVKFEGAAPPAPFSDLEIDGKVIGSMRSSCRNIGLAIIKDDAIEELKNDTNSLRLLG
jgi:folate-binding protein YgfZ